MAKINLYIFNERSRAAVYGIGAYLQALNWALRNSEVCATVVTLHSGKDSIRMYEHETVRYIEIPNAIESLSFLKHTDILEKYYNNVIMLLRPRITDVNNLVFHLNFMHSIALATNLKKTFICHTLLVVHYFDWRFALNGNMQRFRRILADHDDHAKEHIKDMIRDNIAIFNAVDHVVCVTDGSKHVLTDDFHIPESKVTTVHNCLKDAHCRTSKSALRKKYRLPDEWPVIIFAGRLDIIKGLKAAIGAFKRLLKDYPAARLFVCGNGNYDAYMKEISDVCPNVVFTGFVNKRRLYEYYKIADLGVVPSIHEEFGLVTLEMMMHSLPVIVTNNGGPDEIIEDGISGYKIPVRTMRKQQSLDIKIFTDRMKYLLDNKEKAARMGRNARKHFLEAFECSTFRERMLNLYNSLIVK